MGDTIAILACLARQVCRSTMAETEWEAAILAGLHGRLYDGTAMSFDLVGYRYDFHERTHWEMLGPLAACSEGLKSKVDPHVVVRQGRSSWGPIFSLLGFDWGAMVFPSLNSVKAATRRQDDGVVASAFTREVWTIAGACLFLVLLIKAKHSKAPHTRERAEVCLVAILGRLVNAQVLQSLLEQALGEATVALCEMGAVEGVACLHVRQALRVDRSSDPIVTFVRIATSLLGATPSCGACQEGLKVLATAVDKLMHLGLHASSDALSNPLKWTRRELVGGRKRRHGEAFNGKVTEGLIKEGRAISGAATCKVDGVDERRFREWNSLNQKAHLNCMVRVFGSGPPTTVCVSEDAARLGSPALDIKTYTCFLPRLGLASWLPNQAATPNSGFSWASLAAPFYPFNAFG